MGAAVDVVIIKIVFKYCSKSANFNATAYMNFNEKRKKVAESVKIENLFVFIARKYRVLQPAFSDNY